MLRRAWPVVLLIQAACHRPPRPLLTRVSNVTPADYAGPKTCAECHGDIYATAMQHPHAKMNQWANAETVRGDFDDAQVEFRGRAVHFRKSGTGEFLMELEGAHPRRYKVTRTVGSRFMQFYIGVETDGPEPRGDPIYTVEHKLPFAYWFKLGRWFPEFYLDQLGPEYAKGTPVDDPFERPELFSYADNCMVCHNTYPYLSRVGSERQAIAGFPHQDMVRDEEGLNRALLAERGPGADGGPAGHSPKELVVMGITCEACHFGSKDHAENGTPAHLLPESPLFTLEQQGQPLALTATTDKTNGICAQCHTAGSGTYANGASAWNSREALDFLSGSCTSQLTCVGCHDPHVGDPPVEGGPDKPAIAAKCLSCHGAYADSKTLASHQGFPQHAGVSCLDCHMPRFSQGIEAMVRSHHIGAPTDERILSTAGPNACNLCHLDKSIRWTVAELNAGWHTRLDAKPGWAAAYGGDLDAPVGKVWLKSEDQSRRMMAGQAWAESPLRTQVRQELIRALDDDAGVNRIFASFAVEKLLGRPLPVAEYDPTSERQVRSKQIEALLASSRPPG